LRPPAGASAPLPSTTATAAARTPSIPSDPHALLSSTSPTYHLAVSLYRSLLVSVTTDHAHRRAMGSASHLVASKRSWWRAMEDLCDGFRELAAVKARRLESKVELERTSTIELDVVCEKGEDGQLEKVNSPTTSSATSTRKRRLNISKMKKRSKLMSSSLLGPLTTWTTRSHLASSSGSSLAVKATGQLSIGACLCPLCEMLTS